MHSQRVGLCAQDMLGKVSLFRLHRTIGRDGCNGIAILIVCLSTVGSYGIGSTGILTNLLQVNHGQQLAYHIGLDFIGLTPLHGVVMPYDIVHGLGSLHLTCEIVLHLTLYQL